MAKSKTNASTAANAADASNGNAGTTAPKRGRGAQDPSKSISWSAEQLGALIQTVATYNGQLTSGQLAEALAQRPEFADEAYKLRIDGAREKLRVKVNKLSQISEANGMPALRLRKLSNTGQDTVGLLARVFRPQVGPQIGAPVSAQAAPVATAAPVAPVAPPIATSGFIQTPFAGTPGLVGGNG